MISANSVVPNNGSLCSCDRTAQVCHHPRTLRVKIDEAMAMALLQQSGSLGLLNTVFLNGRGSWPSWSRVTDLLCLLSGHLRLTLLSIPDLDIRLLQSVG